MREFTLAALNAGRFDDKICTEIHAWAQMNIGTGLGPKRKDVVISGAVNSVLQGCEISKAKPDSVDDNFAVELKKRMLFRMLSLFVQGQTEILKIRTSSISMLAIT